MPFNLGIIGGLVSLRVDHQREAPATAIVTARRRNPPRNASSRDLASSGTGASYPVFVDRLALPCPGLQGKSPAGRLLLPAGDSAEQARQLLDAFRAVRGWGFQPGQFLAGFDCPPDRRTMKCQETEDPTDGC